MAEVLKPCPFCGLQVECCVINGRVQIRCWNCEISFWRYSIGYKGYLPVAIEHEATVAAWNRRDCESAAEAQPVERPPCEREVESDDRA